MTKIEQVANAVKAITLDAPGDTCEVWVGGECFDIAIKEPRFRGHHDNVVINGHDCGNRHDGVSYLLSTIGDA